MNYEEWEQQVPEVFKAKLLWKMKAYRLALFVSDLGWHDVTKLSKDNRTERLASQLYRSLGSIGANIAEADSRTSGKDRARIHEIAQGESNESQEWYWRGRHVLGEEVALHRIHILDEITRMLAAAVNAERPRVFREEEATYDVDQSANG